jgi:hypothetical protein
LYKFNQGIDDYGLNEVSIKDFTDKYNVFGTIYTTIEDYRNIKTYENEQFALAIYDFNWYEVKTYVFTKENTFVDDNIFIGNSYENIKRAMENPKHDYRQNKYQLMQFGEEYKSYHKNITDITLYFLTGKLCEIQINFVKKSKKDDYFQTILYNEWVSPIVSPNSFGGWFKLVLEKDNNFIISIDSDVFASYTYKGTFQLLYSDDIPVFKMLTYNGYYMDREFTIYKVGENAYAIKLLDGISYMYPNLFTEYLY